MVRLWITVALSASPIWGQSPASSYFPPEAYQLDPAESGDPDRTIPGILLGAVYSGKQLTFSDVARIGLQKFVSMASAQGIAEGGITKALFEGRFNPAVVDLKLAFYGFGDRPDDTEMRAANSYKRNELNDAFRTTQWNKRFGSIGKIGKVKTIVNGVEKELDGRDLLLRWMMAIRQIGMTGLREDPALTYATAMESLKGDPQSRDRMLEALIEATDQTVSAYAYFDPPDPMNRINFNLRADYDNIRLNKYLPAVMGVSSTVVPAARSPVAEEALTPPAPPVAISSDAYFDRYALEAPIVLTGELRQIHYSPNNPLSLSISSPQSGPGGTLWRVSGDKPAVLEERGIRVREVFAIGDKVRVEGFLKKDGSREMSGKRITLPGGKVLELVEGPAAAVTSWTPQAALRGNPSQGKAIFERSCSACHHLKVAGRRGGAVGGPSLAGLAQGRFADQRIATTGALTRALADHLIRDETGQVVVRGFGDLLSRQEQDSVLAFLAAALPSQRSSGLPPAPQSRSVVSKPTEPDRQPVILSRTEPSYTRATREAGIEGSVVLSLTVTRSGTAEGIAVVQSLHPDLDQRAIAALSSWRFLPGIKAGKPAAYKAKVRISFNLVDRR
ncbi:MAG: TonB family protein [Bryobacteraceae bacterium]